MDNEIQNFFVRVFVEPQNISEAENIAVDLCKRFEKYGIPKIESIKPYWKIETYFELLFVVDKCADKISFQHIRAEIGTGWKMLGDDAAVWNVEEEALPLTSLRWASIGLRG